MKIILSPSKTQAEPAQLSFHKENPLLDQKATLSLFNKLRKMSKKDMSEAMSIEGKLLDKTVNLYRNFNPEVSLRVPAIELYTGTVFDQLHLSDYDETQLTYLNEHIRILSAMYGLLDPYTLIWPYRLDFSMKLPKFKLKALWSEKIIKALKSETVIVDLSSQEFSVLLAPLKTRIHQIIFIEKIGGQEKIISTNAKKARGKMAHFMIINHISAIKDLASFCEDGYHYQIDRSTDQCSIFMKESR